MSVPRSSKMKYGPDRSRGKLWEGRGRCVWFSGLFARFLIVHSSSTMVLSFGQLPEDLKKNWHVHGIRRKVLTYESDRHVPPQMISAHVWSFWPHSYHFRDEQVCVHSPPALAFCPADASVSDAAGPLRAHVCTALECGEANAPRNGPLTNGIGRSQQINLPPPATNHVSWDTAVTQHPLRIKWTTRGEQGHVLPGRGQSSRAFSFLSHALCFPGLSVPKQTRAHSPGPRLCFLWSSGEGAML